MLVSLWTMVQFVLLALTVLGGSPAPQSLMQTLLVVALAALVLTPVVPWIFRTLVRALSIAPNAPPARPHTHTPRARRLADDPVASGTAQPRAPSFVVHASA